ncbi:hypothetical protein K402DRAFT_105168 [Aulographum hederae CBS 113979]|uniref:Uncharacterized protein n=1 Tax=Aulographum hederae CBS 113979 TaxID=1176131 RepID=A0A6G1GXU4_9PEZI|nr:hypothetical protein K402DRAFT_105168 [Aulographum hederae CBS 113979]
MPGSQLRYSWSGFPAWNSLSYFCLSSDLSTSQCLLMFLLCTLSTLSRSARTINATIFKPYVSLSTNLHSFVPINGLVEAQPTLNIPHAIIIHTSPFLADCSFSLNPQISLSPCIPFSTRR